VVIVAAVNVVRTNFLKLVIYLAAICKKCGMDMQLDSSLKFITIFIVLRLFFRPKLWNFLSKFTFCVFFSFQVVFSKSRKLFDKILWQKFNFNRKHAVYFEDVAVEDVYKMLLEHQCQMCPDRPPERGFMLLKTHMSKEHSLHYCNICVENLKVCLNTL
jgi:hypothetical protein